MGVTYKLKKEIIEFILGQKREKPQISCRKLVVAIEQGFGLKVSKSSVNDVIKEAHLSNPVGRQPTDLAKIKKFSIPKAKKVQLFGDSFAISAPEPPDQKNGQIGNSQPVPPQNDPPKIQEVPPSSPAIGEKIEIPVTDGSAFAHDKLSEELPLSDIPAPDEKTKLQDDIIESIKEDSPKLRLNDCAIAPFIVWVALREFFQKPVLEEFFKRHTPLGVQEMRIVDVLACFSPQIFENLDVVFEAQNLWLWKLNGWESPPDKTELENLCRFLNETKIPMFDYYLEIGYFCSLVERVKVVISDKKELFIDGRYMFVDSSVSKSLIGCPLERAVLETTRFISGDSPFVLQASSVENFKDVALSLLACGSGDPEFLIRKIILVGVNEHSLAEFNHIPPKSRSFIVSTLISGGEFESIFGVPLNFVSENVVTRVGRQYSFVDLNMELKDDGGCREIRHSVRILAVDRKDLEKIEIIATNIFMKQSTTKQLLAQVPEFQKIQNDETISVLELEKMDALFTSEEGEITIAQAIKTLMTAIVTKMYKNAHFVKFMNEYNLIGLVDFHENDAIVHILPFPEPSFEMPAIIEQTLSICKMETFDGKRVTVHY